MSIPLSLLLKQVLATQLETSSQLYAQHLVNLEHKEGQSLRPQAAEMVEIQGVWQKESCAA